MSHVCPDQRFNGEPPFLQALTLFSAKLLLRIRMAVVADQTMSSDNRDGIQVRDSTPAPPFRPAAGRKAPLIRPLKGRMHDLSGRRGRGTARGPRAVYAVLEIGNELT